MDQSTGEYRCDSCNLQFKTFKQFLSHKYLKHDESELQLEINNYDGASQNASNHFKSSVEMHILKIPRKEQLQNNNNERSKGDILNPTFDFNDHNTTQFRHDAFTESTALPTCSKNVTRCNQESCVRCHSNPKGNKNELTLSMKYSQNESWLESNPQVNASKPSMSSEYNPMEIYSPGIDEQLNRNQKPTSEHSQIQFRGHEMNQQYNVNQSYTLSGIKRKSEINPHVNGSLFAESFEYSPIQFNNCEMNPHFNTNQLRILPEYRRREFDSYEKNQQCERERNQQAAPHGYREMEFLVHEMNAQVNVNQQDVTWEHGDNSFLEWNSSPRQERIYKMDLNLQEKSVDDKKKLYSFGRSNIIYGESKHTDYFEEKREISSPPLQYQLEMTNENFTSNWSLKHSKAQPNETSNTSDSYEFLLNNQNIQSQYYDENTYKCNTLRNESGGNSSPIQYCHSDIGKNPKDCYGFKNQKLDLDKNRVSPTLQKTYLCELCKNHSVIKKH
ncbi:hypothetical protein TNIN_380371 [Trichonephila inaurata madagascariensis]|uniref:C2H2-type domain-containing protein n=1 Tax=Trichonephila inaurata madagascariensis TaxID=2747483 RepID=A0A8X7BYE8_9ARAC|nr:hypothetical protein TNIN_380371 [Trichonephila inaurata madagascariensis]